MLRSLAILLILLAALASPATTGTAYPGASGAGGSALGCLAGGPAIGLYHNRNRTYAAHIGRFLQRDVKDMGQPSLAVAYFGGTRPGGLAVAADLESYYGDGLNT